MKIILFFITTTITLGIATFSHAQTLPSYLPTDGLVGWWPFNGNANDESGNENNGTVNGATLTTDRFGNVGKAYSFDGVNDDIVIMNSNSLNLNTQLSISVWFAIDTSTISAPVLHLIMKGNQNYSIKTAIPNRFSFGKQSIQDIVITPSNSYTVGQWINYTVIFNFPNAEIYLNGLLSNTGSATNLFSTNSDNLTIGSYLSQLFSKTRIDDIGIWNRALTQEEITALYTGSPTNNNGGGNAAAANAPTAISYQAVARNAQGQPLSDAAVQVRFTLLTDSLTGAAEYSESHSLTTNSLGLFTTAFGAGTLLSGTFEGIDWASGSKYLKVELNAGDGFVDIGTQQLLSVPYSMRSNTSAKAGTIENAGLPVYANNAAALAGGLVAGQMYRTATGDLKIVY
jgi:hypothetical protein